MEPVLGTEPPLCTAVLPVVSREGLGCSLAQKTGTTQRNNPTEEAAQPVKHKSFIQFNIVF